MCGVTGRGCGGICDRGDRIPDKLDMDFFKNHAFRKLKKLGCKFILEGKNDRFRYTFNDTDYKVQSAWHNNPASAFLQCLLDFALKDWRVREEVERSHIIRAFINALEKHRGKWINERTMIDDGKDSLTGERSPYAVGTPNDDAIHKMLDDKIMFRRGDWLNYKYRLRKNCKEDSP